MADLAKITAVPLHDLVLRVVIRVTADEAERVAHGGDLHGERSFVRHEGPNCLVCGVDYEPGGSDECAARERVVATVEF